MDGARALRRSATSLAALCAATAMATAQPMTPAAVPAPMPGPPMASEPLAPMGPACATEVGPAPFGPGAGPWESGPNPRPWLLSQLDLRHSASHGRAMGPGGPLRGTSWRNRPYWLSLDGGALLMADRPAPNVRANNDLLGAIGAGWDWDHYWGGQVRVGWSTPELLNTLQTDAVSDDNLFLTDLTLLYYPWGDSRVRPYYRFGVGLTDIEYTNDFGRRQHDMLFTLPLGVGIKYQWRKNVAWRLELMDNLAIGQNETDTMNNLTITAGVEWRLGGRLDGTWGYRPRTGAW